MFIKFDYIPLTCCVSGQFWTLKWWDRANIGLSINLRYLKTRFFSEKIGRKRNFRFWRFRPTQHNKTCVVLWPECQSQQLGFFDGSSNWGFTYTSYNLFRYIFDVNQLHTFYHVFVNPSPLRWCTPHSRFPWNFIYLLLFFFWYRPENWNFMEI